MIDRYLDVELHDTWIDWDDPTHTPDSITAVYIGVQDHWNHPDFEGRDPFNVPLDAAEIEKEILLAGGRDNWHLESPYGKPYYQHFLTLMKILLPETDITPSIADATMFFCLGLGTKKILNLIGCQNAGKSAGAIRIVFTAMFIDPENTVAYVANPFDNAADSTVWGDTLELWYELCNTWPSGREGTPSIFPNGQEYANKRIIFVPGVAKAGKIELRNVKHTGKSKGSKTKGKRTDIGLMFFIVDEINEIDNFAFLTMLVNLFSQDAFFGFTSQNFKDPEDMGGRITEPSGLNGGPSSFDDLDIDKDMFWHSAHSSITLRFDGHRAPNVKAKRKIYSYLINQGNLDRIAFDGGGMESLNYYSQARSFPVQGGDHNTVLSKFAVSSSRHQDPHFQLMIGSTRIAFCDPAFGGRDAAVYGWAEFANATVIDGDGDPFEQELFVVREHFKKIPIHKAPLFDDKWFERMVAVGVDTKDFTAGAIVGPEDQVALHCAEKNKLHGIDPENFGYDFSMRPNIVSSVNRFIGLNSVPFDYNQPPLGHFLENTKQETEDCCKNRVSELAFITNDFFMMKQVRCAEFMDTAITQTQRTYYETKNGKKVIEKKPEYKARWANKSPDERDVLFGLAGMAVMRGFRQGVIGGEADEGGSIWEKINARNLGKARVAQTLG